MKIKNKNLHFNKMGYYKKKKIYKRRRVGRKTTRPFRRKVQRIVNNTLKRNTEVKRWMTGNVETTISTLSQGTNWYEFFQAIQQGTTSYNRIGDKIKVIGMQIKGYVINNADLPVWLRRVMVKFHNQGAHAQGDPLFMNTGANAADSFVQETGMRCIMRPLHPEIVAHTYHDKVMKLTGKNSLDGNHFKRFNIFIKFGKGLQVRYNSSNTGVMNVVPNVQFGIWAAEAGEDVSTGNTVELSYQASIFYTDA